MQLTTAAKTYFTRKLHIGYHQQMITTKNLQMFHLHTNNIWQHGSIVSVATDDESKTNRKQSDLLMLNGTFSSISA